MIKIPWEGWQVVAIIGSGGFGTVYEIRRDLFGYVETAAVKVITIPKDPSEAAEFRNEGYTDDNITEYYKSYLEDIVKEYAIMARLKGYSNIVDCDDIIYTVGEIGVGWQIYIKMERLTPINQVLDRLKAEKEVVRLGMDICNALILCKNRNIIHRDIKPQNIFISKDGNYKLGDFGIAKTAERATSGTKVGTYKYMAPEVFNNRPYGLGVDIYSLGMVMYWLLNEYQSPFMPAPPAIPTVGQTEAAHQRRFSGECIPHPLHGSEALQRVVRKACAYFPEDRYASPEEMLAELKLCAVGDNWTAGTHLTVEKTQKEAESALGNTTNVQPKEDKEQPLREDKTAALRRERNKAENKQKVVSLGEKQEAHEALPEIQRDRLNLLSTNESSCTAIEYEDHTVGVFNSSPKQRSSTALDGKLCDDPTSGTLSIGDPKEAFGTEQTSTKSKRSSVLTEKTSRALPQKEEHRWTGKQQREPSNKRKEPLIKDRREENVTQNVQEVTGEGIGRRRTKQTAVEEFLTEDADVYTWAQRLLAMFICLPRIAVLLFCVFTFVLQRDIEKTQTFTNDEQYSAGQYGDIFFRDIYKVAAIAYDEANEEYVLVYVETGATMPIIPSAYVHINVQERIDVPNYEELLKMSTIMLPFHRQKTCWYKHGKGTPFSVKVSKNVYIGEDVA